MKLLQCKYNDLQRMNVNIAWTQFTYKTGHPSESLFNEGYFNVCKHKVRKGDFVRVLVSNKIEHKFVDLLFTDVESKHLQVAKLKEFDIMTIAPAPEEVPAKPQFTAREQEFLKPGV